MTKIQSQLNKMLEITVKFQIRKVLNMLMIKIIKFLLEEIKCMLEEQLARLIG